MVLFVVLHQIVAERSLENGFRAIADLVSLALVAAMEASIDAFENLWSLKHQHTRPITPP